MNYRYHSGKFRSPAQVVPACEVDVTPVMNMFIILIPFLISMAVFTHLSSHDFKLPADDSAGDAQKAEDLALTVAVATDQIVVARGDVQLGAFPTINGEYDYVSLSALLTKIRPRLPESISVTLAVDEPVVCADIVRSLDSCRGAGFTDVGLASGTNLDQLTAEVSP